MATGRLYCNVTVYWRCEPNKAMTVMMKTSSITVLELSAVWWGSSRAAFYNDEWWILFYYMLNTSALDCVTCFQEFKKHLSCVFLLVIYRCQLSDSVQWLLLTPALLQKTYKHPLRGKLSNTGQQKPWALYAIKRLLLLLSLTALSIPKTGTFKWCPK